ncbi:NAD(P)-binding protein [Wilcoxina mikolae CBS 423.85]|nr:NAD(P)-binding protein [Wilcoxina mikolae CBS 423.85]
MSAPIGLALLGSGIFAREQHLPAILSSPSFHLKAIYSRTASSATSLASSASLDVDIYSSESSNDLEALLKREDISAVIIGLPIPIQPSVIRACLLANKHVLSEKPIAPTIASACELLQFSRPLPALWGVGENYRFQSSWYYAREAIVSFGRVLNFNIQISSMVEGSNRFYHTSWRKTPEYQGGFILDGEVHFIAGLRMLLGEEEEVKRVAAFSAANMEYLPPVDTVNAVMRTKGGKVGYFALSFGTTMKGFEFTVACEGGVVVVGGGGKVKVTPRGGEETVKDFSEEKNGVEQEVKAFAKAILEGKLDERQTPENALKDLELIEKMLLSGEKDGESMEITGGLGLSTHNVPAGVGTRA